MKPIIPMFYYPLKALFVDDDKELLKAYHYLDLPNNVSVEHNPNQAVQEILNNVSKNICVFNDITEKSHTDSLTTNQEAILSFTFASIKELICDQDKYNKYGILVTDYQMGIMNGIKLCEHIGELDIIKILLTGEYNPLNAVSALNNNTIDYFLQKGKPTTTNELIESIRELQLKYFKNIAQNFLNMTDNKLSFLADKAFARLVNDLIKENNITEYYLLNNTGCFLMMGDGNIFVLNIFTDIDLDIFCDMYSHIATDLTRSVRLRQLVPNFELPSSQNLTEYFYPCKKFGKYYFNFSELKNLNILKVGK
ncbi:MAG: hypothetical protein QG673_20 [Pseudomonadota bacterium]|nr:hypothetical protein [Pseudomonadota bacterium]